MEILDALCDIAYVSVGNGTMLHGLKSKIWPAYQEVQASNMSKACKTEEEAMETVRKRTEEYGEACYFEKLAEGRYIVYRERDKKVVKSINYFRPNLKQFLHDRINMNIKLLKEKRIVELFNFANNIYYNNKSLDHKSLFATATYLDWLNNVLTKFPLIKVMRY